MKNKQPVERCNLTIPITSGFLDPDLVEQVVKETFVRELRRDLKKKLKNC
jgi:hypothetical protein